MEIKVGPQLFRDDPFYLVNELNKKHTRQAFDDVQIVADSIYCFKINGKWNAATKKYVETHKDRKDYKKSVIFDKLIIFPNFVVLKNNNSVGVKIVKQNQSIFYESGKVLFCEPNRYVVIDNNNSIQIIYCSYYGAKELYMPCAGTNYIQAENEKDPASLKYSFTNLTEAKEYITINEFNNMFELLKLLLNEDRNFYDQPISKYVLMEDNSKLAGGKLNKSLNSYKIELKKYAFESKEEFEQNEQNVLNFYRTAILLSIENKLKL